MRGSQGGRLTRFPPVLSAKALALSMTRTFGSDSVVAVSSYRKVQTFILPSKPSSTLNAESESEEEKTKTRHEKIDFEGECRALW